MPITIDARNIAAGTGTSQATSKAAILASSELYISVTELTPANLADPDLHINLIVEGNNNPSGGIGWYEVANMGGWDGAIQLKGQPAGTFAPCEFGFRNPSLHVIERYRLKYTTNKAIFAGLSVVEQDVTSVAKVK